MSLQSAINNLRKRARERVSGFPSAISRQPSAGFTLIELLAVTAIIIVVSTLVFANNNKFGGQVQLENLAYDIALSIRQAQVYGISVAQFNSTYAPAYGMHFQLQNSNPSGPDTYITFADAATVDGLYSAGELVQSTNIRAGYRITALCVTPAVGEETCAPVGGALDITFKRPEPDAYIRASWTVGLSQSARIQVSAPSGFKKSIVIWVNGQLSVQ